MTESLAAAKPAHRRMIQAEKTAVSSLLLTNDGQPPPPRERG